MNNNELQVLTFVIVIWLLGVNIIVTCNHLMVSFRKLYSRSGKQLKKIVKLKLVKLCSCSLFDKNKNHLQTTLIQELKVHHKYLFLFIP